MAMKIGIIGDKESVLGFKACGLDTKVTESRDEAISALNSLAETCAIIFVTETIAQEIKEEIDKYYEKTVPAIILIPSASQKPELGRRMLTESVEKAVGGNILKNN